MQQPRIYTKIPNCNLNMHKYMLIYIRIYKTLLKYIVLYLYAYRLLLVIIYQHVIAYTLCASICPMYAHNVYMHKTRLIIHIETTEYN